MLNITLLVTVYVGLTLIEKLKKKEELAKAKEEHYDVYFNY